MIQTPKVKWLFEQVQTPFRLLAFISFYYKARTLLPKAQVSLNEGEERRLHEKTASKEAADIIIKKYVLSDQVMAAKRASISA